MLGLGCTATAPYIRGILLASVFKFRARQIVPILTIIATTYNKSKMSSFDNQSNLQDRTRISMDFDSSHDGSTESNSAIPAPSKPRSRPSQADIKLLNPHFLCPSCDNANKIAANLSTHWKRKHAAKGPWIVGNVRMVQDGQTFRYKDRHLHNVQPKSANATQNAKQWDYETIYRRTAACLPRGTPKLDILRKVSKIYDNRPMSDAELDTEIAIHKEALALFTDEKLARDKVTTTAANKARGKAQLLAHRLHDFISRGRKIFARKDGTYTYNRNDPRERSPERSQMAGVGSYRDRTDPIPGGILRRPTTPAITHDPTIPVPPPRISSLIARRRLTRSESTGSATSVTFPGKYGTTRKTDESESSSEGSVSEED